MNDPIPLSDALVVIRPSATALLASGSGNNLRHVHGLLLGGQGKGKTIASDAIASFFGGTGFRSRNLAALLTLPKEGEGAFTTHPALVLVWEDATLEDVPSSLLRKWYQIRHLFGRRGSTGLVVTVTNIHTFYGLKKDLRTEFDFMLIKSVPTNRNDRSMLRVLIGGDNTVSGKARGEEFLRWLEKQSLLSLTDPSKLRFGLLWTRDGVTTPVSVPDVPSPLSEIDMPPIKSTNLVLIPVGAAITFLAWAVITILGG